MAKVCSCGKKLGSDNTTGRCKLHLHTDGCQCAKCLNRPARDEAVRRMLNELWGKQPEAARTIARAIGVTEERVRQIARALGLPKLPKRSTDVSLQPVPNRPKGITAAQMQWAKANPETREGLYLLLVAAKPDPAMGRKAWEHPYLTMERA